MPHTKRNPQPTHIAGTMRGEEMALNHGREPGRSTDSRNYRTSRDSTGINARSRGPILPQMPNLPPA